MGSNSAAKNLYAAANKNSEEDKRRRLAEVDARLEKILKHNPGRRPNWSEERLQQIDELALEHRKRCIMWDDEGAGFYMMMNWDWQQNRPAPIEKGRRTEPGWYENIRTMLKPPLFDPNVPEDKLADWVDSHTMRVHQFLDKLHQIREDSSGKLVIMP